MINNIDTEQYFSQPSLIIFTKGANNSDHVCMYVQVWYVQILNVNKYEC